MFPSQRLKDTAAQHLVRNHEDRLLPQDCMDILVEEGFFGLEAYTTGCRNKFGQMVALGFEDLSLALIASMDRSARALYFDDTVPSGRQSYLARIMEGKILATFVSGLNTRSQAGIASFNSDVVARKVKVGAQRYLQIWGTKGVATNAEGCDYAAVSVKDEGDDSEFGGRFVFVKMRDDAGNLAEGITIHDTGRTLGVPSTRSCSVAFDDVLIPEHLVLPRVPNLLTHFLIKNASDSFGDYTGGYIGAAKRTVAYMMDKNRRERLTSRIATCWNAVVEAEAALLEAADMKDDGEPPMAVAQQLLKAKRSIGAVISDQILPLASYMSGFHDLAFDWNKEGVPVFIAGIWMANPQPPSSPMIDDIFSGDVQLPPL